MVASTSSFYGVDHEFLQSKVNKATEWFERKVSESGRREECEKKTVKKLNSQSSCCELLMMFLHQKSLLANVVAVQT